MNKLKVKIVSTALMAVVLTITFMTTGFWFNEAMAQSSADITPALKSNSQEYNIAVIRSGEYWQYAANFNNLLSALQELGWINEVSLSEEALKTVPGILSELKGKDYSDYLVFRDDFYFDFEFNEAKAADPKFKQIMTHKTEIDLIISLGTRAGKVFAALKPLEIPVIALQISDPVKAGIITSCEDSGNPFITARCDPDRYVRQVKVFHDVVNFQKLGMIYEDTPAGKSISAIDLVETMAKERGFEIVRDTEAINNGPKAPAEYLQSLKKIAPQIDAMYLTIHGGLTLANLPQIMAILNQHKIPTFAMEGPDFVRHGVLLSISSQEQLATGEYNAKKIAQILKGKQPGSLDQVFTISPMIAINLEEAMLIDYDPPVDILAAADEVYEEITEPGQP